MAIKTFNPTTPSRRNMTVLSYKGLLDLFEKALLGLHLRQTLAGKHSHISARGRRRVESLDSHLEFQLLDTLLSGWLPHTITSFENTFSNERGSTAHSADETKAAKSSDQRNFSSLLYKNRDTCSRFL